MQRIKSAIEAENGSRMWHLIYFRFAHAWVEQLPKDFLLVGLPFAARSSNLLINGAIYVLCGVVSRHFKRELLPIGLVALKRDLTDALRLRLVHEKGVYNAVQRLMYWMVLAAGALVVISGVAIWKPIQLQELVALLGG